MTAPAPPPGLARVDLKEAGGWTVHRLTDGQARTLSRSELTHLRPSGTPGHWQVRARDQVGAVRLGTGPDSAVQLRIAPKVTVDRILPLLSHAAHRAHWYPEPVDGAERPDLLPAVAHALASAAERALLPGLLLGYRESEEALPVLRGRLRVSAQLRRHPGLALPIEVTYDDHTTDIPENRLLLGACRRLLRLPDLDASCRGRLRTLAARLDGVTPPTPGAPPPAWTATRLNVRYRSALRLAGLVLRGASYELEDGRTIQVDGLLLRMWQVYEAFLAGALGEELTRLAGGRAEAQDPTHFLDSRRRYRLKPDLVHYLPGPHGLPRPAVVVDAKYKRGHHPDDLYQMLAYCVCLGLPDGHLVYAAGPQNTVDIPTGTGAPVRVHRYTLDLSRPYPELRSALVQLAAAIHPRPAQDSSHTAWS